MSSLSSSFLPHNILFTIRASRNTKQDHVEGGRRRWGGGQRSTHFARSWRLRLSAPLGTRPPLCVATPALPRRLRRLPPVASVSGAGFRPARHADCLPWLVNPVFLVHAFRWPPFRGCHLLPCLLVAMTVSPLFSHVFTHTLSYIFFIHGKKLEKKRQKLTKHKQDGPAWALKAKPKRGLMKRKRSLSRKTTRQKTFRM